MSYITVSNLEITNDDADVYDPIDTWKWTDTPDSDGTKLDRSASRMDAPAWPASPRTARR